MRRLCPWCCEPIGIAERSAARCPSCGRPLEDDQGRELRAIDLRYDRVEARLWERFRHMLVVGVPVVAVLSLALSFLHFTAIAFAPLLTVVHLVVVRLYLVREPRRLLGPARRRFLRWLSRLGFLWLGVPGYALAAAPLVGLIPGVGTFAGLTTAAWAYTRWSLTEERDRQPLARWERLLLWGLGGLTLVILAALAAATVLIGWSVAALFSE